MPRIGGYVSGARYVASTVFESMANSDRRIGGKVGSDRYVASSVFAPTTAGAPSVYNGQPTGANLNSAIPRFSCNVSAGTARLIAAPPAALVGITAEEVLDGQVAGGGAPAADSGSLALTSYNVQVPDLLLPLSPGLYGLAAAVETTEGDSNVLIWTMLLRHPGFDLRTLGTPFADAKLRIADAVNDINSGEFLEVGEILGSGVVTMGTDGRFFTDSTVRSFRAYCGNMIDGWRDIGVQTMAAPLGFTGGNF